MGSTVCPLLPGWFFLMRQLLCHGYKKKEERIKKGGHMDADREEPAFRWKSGRWHNSEGVWQWEAVSYPGVPRRHSLFVNVSTVVYLPSPRGRGMFIASQLFS